MKKWLVIAAVLLIASGGGWFMYNQTRGLRNNNPGNIRRGEQWQGMALYQQDDEFVTFDDPVYGIRALNRVLKSYAERHNLHTVREIINRWAPPNENDTGSYVQSVASRLGVNPDQWINVAAYAPQLTEAIIKHENGLQPYDSQTIAEGVRLGWA